MEKIKETFGTSAAMKKLTDRLNESMNDENAVNKKARDKLIKAVSDYERKINNLVKAVADGFDAAAARAELERLQEEKEFAEKELAGLEREIAGETGAPKSISPEEMRGLYSRFEEAFQVGTNKEKKKLLRCFVRRIEYDPREDKLTVYMLGEPNPGNGGTKAVWFSFGAQDGTCIVCHSVSGRRVKGTH